MTIKGFELAVSTMCLDEISIFRCHPDYAYGSDGFENIIAPNSWLTFKISLVHWSWEDISRRRDNSITRYIIEPGINHGTPSSVSLVNIHLVQEKSGLVVDERDVEFRLGDGKKYNICPGIEIALTKFKLKEKSRLCILGKHTLGFTDDGDNEEYVITLNYFEKVKLFLHICFMQIVCI